MGYECDGSGCRWDSMESWVVLGTSCLSGLFKNKSKTNPKTPTFPEINQNPTKAKQTKTHPNQNPTTTTNALAQTQTKNLTQDRINKQPKTQHQKPQTNSAKQGRALTAIFEQMWRISQQSSASLRPSSHL